MTDPSDELADETVSNNQNDIIPNENASIDGIPLDELANLPEITEHAKDRWEMRTPDSAKSIGHAWYYGENINIIADRLRDRHGNEAEKARLYHAITIDGVEYTVILISRHEKLKTVLGMDALGGPHRGGKKVKRFLKKKRDENVIHEDDFSKY